MSYIYLLKDVIKLMEYENYIELIEDNYKSKKIKTNEALVLFNKMPHIAMSTGSACTSGTITRSHVLSALKLNDKQIDESFRVSFGRETSSKDIKQLISHLEKN